MEAQVQTGQERKGWDRMGVMWEGMRMEMAIGKQLATGDGDGNRCNGTGWVGIAMGWAGLGCRPGWPSWQVQVRCPLAGGL